MQIHTPGKIWRDNDDVMKKTEQREKRRTMEFGLLEN